MQLHAEGAWEFRKSHRLMKTDHTVHSDMFDGMLSGR